MSSLTTESTGAPAVTNGAGIGGVRDATNPIINDQEAWMPYLNLDDNFADHPKVDRLSDGAFRLHVAGLCHAAKHLTDGVIPVDRPSRLVPKFKLQYVAELMERGLWVEVPGGYELHDYLDWNQSKAWWEKKRAADAERKRRWREANGKGDDDVTP